MLVQLNALLVLIERLMQPFAGTVSKGPSGTMAAVGDHHHCESINKPGTHFVVYLKNPPSSGDEQCSTNPL